MTSPERRLEATNAPLPTLGTGASWRYSITHGRRRFTQHVFHFPDENQYRTRLFEYRDTEPGRGLEESIEEIEFWRFGDGAFQTLDQAVDHGTRLVAERDKGRS